MNFSQKPSLPIDSSIVKGFSSDNNDGLLANKLSRRKTMNQSENSQLKSDTRDNKDESPMFPPETQGKLMKGESMTPEGLRNRGNTSAIGNGATPQSVISAKDDKGNIPQLVKYRLQNDDVEKWNALRNQYKKLYNNNSGGNTNTNQNMKSGLGGQSSGHNNLVVPEKNKSNNASFNTKASKGSKFENLSGMETLREYNRSSPNENSEKLARPNGSEENNDNRNRKNKFSESYKGLLKNISVEIPRANVQQTIMSDDEYDNESSSKNEKDKKVSGSTVLSFGPRKDQKRSPGLELSGSPGLRSHSRNKHNSHSYIEEYLHKINFQGRKDAFEVNKDLVINEELEVEREIDRLKRKKIANMDHMQMLTERKRNRKNYMENQENRQISLQLEKLREEGKYLDQLLSSQYEKLNMMGFIKQQSIQIEEAKTKEIEYKARYENELNSLREILSNVDESKLLGSEKEVLRLREELDKYKKLNFELQTKLDQKSTELSFLYADAENTKQSIINQLKDLKEIKDKVMAERKQIDFEREELTKMKLVMSPEQVDNTHRSFQKSFDNGVIDNYNIRGENVYPFGSNTPFSVTNSKMDLLSPKEISTMNEKINPTVPLENNRNEGLKSKIQANNEESTEFDFGMRKTKNDKILVNSTPLTGMSPVKTISMDIKMTPANQSDNDDSENQTKKSLKKLKNMIEAIKSDQGKLIQESNQKN